MLRRPPTVIRTRPATAQPAVARATPAPRSEASRRRPPPLPMSKRNAQGDDDGDDDEEEEAEEQRSNTTKYALLAVLALSALVGAYYYWKQKPATPPGPDEETETGGGDGGGEATGEEGGGGGGGGGQEAGADETHEDTTAEENLDRCAEICRGNGDLDADCVADCVRDAAEVDDDVKRAVDELDRDAEREAEERARNDAEKQRIADERAAFALDAELHPPGDEAAYDRAVRDAVARQRAKEWRRETDRDEAASALQMCAYRARLLGSDGNPEKEAECAAAAERRREQRNARRQARGTLIEGDVATHLVSPDGLVRVYASSLGLLADWQTLSAVGAPHLKPLDVPPEFVAHGALPPERMRDGYSMAVHRNGSIVVSYRTGEVRLVVPPPAHVRLDSRAPKRLTLDGDGVVRLVEVRVPGAATKPSASSSASSSSIYWSSDPAHASERVLHEWHTKFRWPPATNLLDRDASGAYLRVGYFYQLTEPSPGLVIAPPEDNHKSNGGFVYRLDKLSAVRYELRHIADHPALIQAAQQSGYDRFDQQLRRVEPRVFDYFGFSDRLIHALPHPTGQAPLANSQLVYCAARPDDVYLLQRGQRRRLQNPRQDTSGLTSATLRGIGCADLAAIDRGPDVPEFMPPDLKETHHYKCTGADGVLRTYRIEQEHKRLYVHQPPPERDVTAVECRVLALVGDGPEI